MLAYPISGGCLNPAVGVGISFVNFIYQKGEASAIEYIWIYAGMPFVGALIAVLFFETIYKLIQLNLN
jgi:glycerol uptake facilitator-like aquaporin